MSLPGTNVRVVNIDGHPHLATVLPYIEPTHRTWPYQFGKQGNTNLPDLEINLSYSVYDYIRTREDQEN